jgi:hypothetical protein
MVLENKLGGKAAVFLSFSFTNDGKLLAMQVAPITLSIIPASQEKKRT